MQAFQLFDMLDTYRCDLLGARNSYTSPTPGSNTRTTGSTDEMKAGVDAKCSICKGAYAVAKVLNSSHMFCKSCSKKDRVTAKKVTCPESPKDAYLPTPGLTAVMSAHAVGNITESLAMRCTGCKSKEMNVVARCFDCANFLCSSCVMAHQFMRRFEGHRVLTLAELHSNKGDINVTRPSAVPVTRTTPSGIPAKQAAFSSAKSVATKRPGAHMSVYPRKWVKAN